MVNNIRSEQLNKRTKRRRFTHNLSLRLIFLTPAGFFMIVLYGISLLVFLRYSFYGFSNGKLYPAWILDSWKQFFTHPYYWGVVLSTLKLAVLVTIISIAIGYPLAYFLYRLNRPKLQQWLAALIFMPLLVSVVVRSYGWLILLSDRGLINYILLSIGVIKQPIHLVYNFTGVVIASIHVLLPFACFPIFSLLMRFDPALKEASTDLGASRLQTFRYITFPISLPGVIGAVQLVFPLILSAFVTPALLGGGRVTVLSQQVYQSTISINWPIAAVDGAMLLVITMLCLLIIEWIAKLLFGNLQSS
jgi:putative spermidine/putrescine transport system permease protein